MRTGMTQDSTVLLEESGLRSLWKAPISPWEKNPCRYAPQLTSGLWSLFPSIHQGISLSLWWAKRSKMHMVCVFHWWLHHTGQSLRPFVIAKLFTDWTCPPASETLVDEIRMSSACPKAPRKRPCMLRPRFLDLRFASNGSMTTFNRAGDSTDPWRIVL